MKVISGPGELERLKEEARHIYYAAPIIFPLLQRRKEEAYNRLIASFRQGNSNNTTIVAELTVITEIERELKTKLDLIENKEG